VLHAGRRRRSTRRRRTLSACTTKTTSGRGAAQSTPPRAPPIAAAARLDGARRALKASGRSSPSTRMVTMSVRGEAHRGSYHRARATPPTLTVGRRSVRPRLRGAPIRIACCMRAPWAANAAQLSRPRVEPDDAAARRDGAQRAWKACGRSSRGFRMGTTSATTSCRPRPRPLSRPAIVSPRARAHMMLMLCKRGRYGARASTEKIRAREMRWR
jgi:hypothetical protein